MKGLSCHGLSTMCIFDLWMNNEYIYVNCKLINIVIYIIDFFFISYEMCWLTEYPVGDVSFLLFEYNTHFFAPPP